MAERFTRELTYIVSLKLLLQVLPPLGRTYQFVASKVGTKEVVDWDGLTRGILIYLMSNNRPTGAGCVLVTESKKLRLCSTEPHQQATISELHRQNLLCLHTIYQS